MNLHLPVRTVPQFKGFRAGQDLRVQLHPVNVHGGDILGDQIHRDRQVFPEDAVVFFIHIPAFHYRLDGGVFALFCGRKRGADFCQLAFPDHRRAHEQKRRREIEQFQLTVHVSLVSQQYAAETALQVHGLLVDKVNLRDHNPHVRVKLIEVVKGARVHHIQGIDPGLVFFVNQERVHEDFPGCAHPLTARRINANMGDDLALKLSHDCEKESPSFLNGNILVGVQPFSGFAQVKTVPVEHVRQLRGVFLFVESVVCLHKCMTFLCSNPLLQMR